MKFKSITMENFMRYKGVNTIEFSCDPGKNVTVVLGKNNDCTGFPLRVIRSCKYGEMEKCR